MIKQEKFLNLKNWAVAGVTEDKNKYGYKIFRILLDHDYNVFGINPKYDEIDGEKLYPNLKEIDEKIDVLNLIVSPKISNIYLKSAKELGIEKIWFQPGSFDDETLELTKELGFEFIDDDCVYAILKKVDEK